MPENNLKFLNFSLQTAAFRVARVVGSVPMRIKLFKDRLFRDFWFFDELRQRLFGADPWKECSHHCASRGKKPAIIDLPPPRS